ncbi:MULTISPECIES: hypothetical protein [Pelosinus]|uniref:Uncharacterized protein n=1 Tax=Pelosinus fermentans B4 TaxID=1149862 RepID=I8RJ36_9FIRM|nr:MULTISPECIES: hypothetical protein [Pelosinus]EIW19963.1 hypothetical protein FB4_0214 [Pelosinus fermentans B4]EIW21180.1 hypothetical protein FA11_0907 [Pelosinus fermentans A11]
MAAKAREKITRWDDLPDVLTAQHIADYENISRRRVYELFQTSPAHGGIANYDIGTSKRVEKVDYAAWRATQKGKNKQKFVAV